MYIPQTETRIPFDAWAIITSVNGYDSYSIGPDATGVPLQSGNFFSGRWGGWFDGSKIVIDKLTGVNVNVREGFTGYALNWFGSTFNTSDSSRFQNFSLSFDNSGVPLVAFQDNGDSSAGFLGKPSVEVFQLSGESVISTGWPGTSPGLFNSLQTNGLFNPVPTPSSLRYQTGFNTCFYQRGNNLCYRSQTGFKWSNEFTIGEVTSGFSPTRTRVDVVDYDFNKPYNPYKVLLITPNSDGTRVRILSSRPMVNFAWDNYKQSTGELPVSENSKPLTGGYGAWGRNYVFGSSLNKIVSLDFYHFDSFNYPTGLTEPLTGSGWSLISGYSSTQFTGTTFQNQFLIFETFNYPTGQISGYGATGSLTGLLLDEPLLNSGLFKSGYSTLIFPNGHTIWSGYLV